MKYKDGWVQLKKSKFMKVILFSDFYKDFNLVCVNKSDQMYPISRNEIKILIRKYGINNDKQLWLCHKKDRGLSKC